jgi:hypothetical protein
MSENPPRPPVRRAHKVPPSARPSGHIRRLKGGQAVQGTVCSPKFHGFFLHFDKLCRRSEACYEDPERCPGCKKKLPQKTLWYVYLWTGPNQMEWVELTDGAARQWEYAMAGRQSWIGARVCIERTRADKGRLNVTIMEYSEKPELVPADKSPIELLHFLWGARRT